MRISGCLQAGFIQHAESAGWEAMAPSQLLSNVLTPQQLRDPASSITRISFIFLSLHSLKNLVLPGILYLPHFNL